MFSTIDTQHQSHFLLFYKQYLLEFHNQVSVLFSNVEACQKFYENNQFVFVIQTHAKNTAQNKQLVWCSHSKACLYFQYNKQLWFSYKDAKYVNTKHSVWVSYTQNVGISFKTKQSLHFATIPGITLNNTRKIIVQSAFSVHNHSEKQTNQITHPFNQLVQKIVQQLNKNYNAYDIDQIICNKQNLNMYFCFHYL